MSKEEHCDNLYLLNMLLDLVAGELLEADIVAHLKQILSASSAVAGLLHNSLMLVKSLCAIGEFSITVGAVVGTRGLIVRIWYS